MNIVELRKAEWLGHLPPRLTDWIAYFEHWREDATISHLTHPPVQKAYAKLRTLSADEQARHWAEPPAKALSDEATLQYEAREEGREEGRHLTARAMIEQTQLDDATVARVAGLPLEDIRAMRGESSASGQRLSTFVLTFKAPGLWEASRNRKSSLDLENVFLSSLRPILTWHAPPGPKARTPRSR